MQPRPIVGPEDESGPLRQSADSLHRIRILLRRESVVRLRASDDRLRVRSRIPISHLLARLLKRLGRPGLMKPLGPLCLAAAVVGLAFSPTSSARNVAKCIAASSLLPGSRAGVIRAASARRRASRCGSRDAQRRTISTTNSWRARAPGPWFSARGTRISTRPACHAVLATATSTGCSSATGAGLRSATSPAEPRRAVDPRAAQRAGHGDPGGRYGEAEDGRDALRGGTAQYHINAAISHAVRQFVRVTGDSRGRQGARDPRRRPGPRGGEAIPKP